MNTETENGYANAPATKMLAIYCAICGRPLVDAQSIERGIGPDCAARLDIEIPGVSDEIRKVANGYVHQAAVVAQNGEISRVLEIAEKIRGLGLQKLADRVARRFRNADRYTEFIIMVEDGMYRVDTPFRRKAKGEFIVAWRRIPGRRWKNE